MTLKQVVAASFAAGAAAAGDGAGAVSNTPPMRRSATPFRTAAMSARWRSIPRPASSSCSRYLVVDDVGTVINPLTLAGQIHGGVAQGVGQILMEQVVYEPGSRAVADGEFHGLRHAARGQYVQHQDRQQSGADGRQSAGCEGCGRGRHGRRAARGDDRHHARAGAAGRARTRHAGDARSGVAGDTARRRRRVNDAVSLRGAQQRSNLPPDESHCGSSGGDCFVASAPRRDDRRPCNDRRPWRIEEETYHANRRRLP